MRKTTGFGLHNPLYTALSTLAVLGPATPAMAVEGALEEIIVTATRRSESVQDVPMAITAFSSEVIEDAEVHNASDLAVITPSLAINTNTQPFTAAFRIRGIGTSQSDVALEPSVGLFVDDVYLNRSGLGMSDLSDIERIEVLHGPQGTLYGKNTSAGAVAIFTRLPNVEEFEGYLEATAGNYGLQRYTLTASGPISRSLAYRISGTVHERDGFYDNSAGNDLNTIDDWDITGKLLFEPTDDLSIQIKGNRVNRDSRCCAADAVQTEPVNNELEARGLPIDQNDPFDFDVAVDVDNEFLNETDNLSLVVDYEQDWGDIKSITAWSKTDGEVSYDVDRSELDVMSFVGAVSDSDIFSQELRLTSSWGDSLDYQLGLFYFQSTTRSGDGRPFLFLGEDFISQADQQPGLGGSLPPGVSSVSFIAQPGDSLSTDSVLDTDSVAVFGQTTWHVRDNWRLTAGLRWTHEDKDADLLTVIDSTAPSAALTGFSFLNTVSSPIDASLSRSSSDVDWLINASVDLRQDTMLFASVATGSKSGGFNTSNGTPEEREFDDESTISYEVGVKSTLLDARLRINASAFYTEIDDFQFQQQLETGIGTRVSNQAQVETSGLDVEMQARPLPFLTLTAGLVYMHSYEITDGPQDGDDLAFTAEYSANAAATLVFPLAGGGLFLRADYSYMDDHLTSSSADFEERDIQDRSVLNAKLGWRGGGWDVSIWGKNLTDNEYAELTAAPFPPTGMEAYFLAPPRTYGATLRYDF